MTISKQTIFGLIIALSVTHHTWTTHKATVLSKKVTIVLTPAHTRTMLSDFSKKAQTILPNISKEIAQREYKRGAPTMYTTHLRDQATQLTGFIRNQTLLVTASAVGTNASENIGTWVVGKKGAKKLVVEVPNQVHSDEHSNATQRTQYLQVSVTPTNKQTAEELNLGYTHHHPYKKIYVGQKLPFSSSPASEKKYGVNHETNYIELP